jgi:acyl carrier protein
MDRVDDTIRQVLAEHGQLLVDANKLSPEDDLFRMGMGSMASINVMLALEETFGVEFPEEMLTRNTFSTISSIKSALERLGVADVAATD